MSRMPRSSSYEANLVLALGSAIGVGIRVLGISS